ncbi:MAG: bifunctional diguanylate cyclase/phosphodiesterase [Gammaproteobacteria bacterium]|nr:bifunctional diguanylate cyclase/phosphodiesterase [Gammaproteobacteria bacterium]
MKLRISSFNALLIGGFALVMFLLWIVSLLMSAERQNQQAGTTQQHNLRVQVQQLQQNQQLWLQSQYYLLNMLVKSPDDNQNFQSFLWGYYQRNPNIWAVNLVQFDERGLPVSKSNKPGCLQPDQMLRYRFDNFLVPSISSCRIDDKALLEIAGPVVADGDAVVLLVSMEYFDFLNEFSSLTGRRMQRAADSAESFQYYEFGASEYGKAQISIPIGHAGAVSGVLHLKREPLSLWALFEHQAVVVLVLLALAVITLLVLLHVFLVKPLQSLAGKMRFAALGHLEDESGSREKVKTGLTEMVEYFNLMQKTARLDPVTGLNNRVIFEDRLVQAIREGKRSGRKYALIMIDIQRLDELVQERGQYIVDALLRQIAEGLRESLRESDHVSRFERNLFALLLEVQQIEQLNNLVEKIYLSLIRRYRVYGREVDLDAYIGIAIYPDHAVDADGLYHNASTALVEAEHSEWPIQFFQDAEDDTDITGFTMIQSLRRAIERDELKLVYQPVVDLQSYQTQYLEALLRWKDPDMHDISIEQTIRLAEQNHLIKSLTNWIIDSACRFVSQADMQDVAVGINLSMIDLHDRRLPERIETYLNHYQVRPSQIVIEITEGQIMQDPEEVIEVLARLGVMGLSLSIDDFGTGQASLTYLKELPVEKIKIDQSFVRDIVTDPDDQLIVRATIELAHTLDLKVVAEGVETLAVYEMLTEMSCDHVQGYYISRPLEAEQVSRWLDTSVKPDLVRKGR